MSKHQIDPAFLARIIAACRDGQSPAGAKLIDDITKKASPVITVVLKLRILSTNCHRAEHLSDDIKSEILSKYYELLIILTEIETTLNILDGMKKYIEEVPAEAVGPMSAFAMALAQRGVKLTHKADDLEAEGTLLVTQHITDLFPEVAAKMEQMK